MPVEVDARSRRRTHPMMSLSTRGRRSPRRAEADVEGAWPHGDREVGQLTSNGLLAATAATIIRPMSISGSRPPR